MKNLFKTRHSSEHGGNIYRLAEELKIPERRIVDFSASINPLGVSKKVKAEIRKYLKYLNNYPDPDTKRLRNHLGRYHRIDPESILCGNGSTELIYLIARALKPEKVLLPAPTFSEYERACIISNELQVTSYELKKENNFDINPKEFIDAIVGKDRNNTSIKSEVQNNSSLVTRYSSLKCDMAFLCNHNSPTGRLLRKDDVLKIASAAENLKCYLVVDEAFIDFSPEESVIKEVERNPYLIVLRSMTKFYALSGMRLGYGVFPLSLVDVIKRQKEPWTVNTLAQRAGAAAIKDTAYKKETFGLMTQEKQFMERGFKRLGIDYIPSSANFYLITLEHAQKIIASLRSKGIIVRNCSNFIGLDESYIRVAVKSRRDNIRLLKELADLCKA